MTVIRIVSAIIFAISIMAIWKNIISFSTKQKIVYIVLGVIIISIITSLICNIQLKNIEIQNIEKQKIIKRTIECIFIPINLLIYCTPIGVTLNKFKDNAIKKDKLKKRFLIITIVFIIILIFESNYIANFYRGVLNA